MNYYFKVLKNYATFSGRARRSEYWYFVLFHFIVSFILEFIGIKILNILYMIAVIIPGIALAVRRAHDVGKSGWCLLIPVYNFTLLFLDSEQKENKYGLNPKESINEDSKDKFSDEHIIRNAQYKYESNGDEYKPDSEESIYNQYSERPIQYDTQQEGEPNNEKKGFFTVKKTINKDFDQLNEIIKSPEIAEFLINKKFRASKKIKTFKVSIKEISQNKIEVYYTDRILLVFYRKANNEIEMEVKPLLINQTELTPSNMIGIGIGLFALLVLKNLKNIKHGVSIFSIILMSAGVTIGFYTLLILYAKLSLNNIHKRINERWARAHNETYQAKFHEENF